jgi:DnaD/phage-associated family protein
LSKERFVNARKRRGGFTTVVNTMLDDQNLSLEAKGLLTIFLSNNQDIWEIKMKEIFKRSNTGRDAQYNVINELILEGYFCRIHVSNKNGKHEEMIYIYSDRKEEVINAIKEEVLVLTNMKKKLWVETPRSEKFYNKKFPKKLLIRIDEIQKELENQGLLPYPEIQETESNQPHPENPETEKPDTVYQDINNTKSNKPIFNNTKSSKYVSSNLSAIDIFKENYKLTTYAKENLESFIISHGEELTKAAVIRTVEKGKEENMIAYIKGTLQNWDKLNLKTMGQVESHEAHYREEKTKKSKRSQQQKPREHFSSTSKEDKQLPKSIAGQIEIELSREEIAATYEDINKMKALLGITEKEVLNQ